MYLNLKCRFLTISGFGYLCPEMVQGSGTQLCITNQTLSLVSWCTIWDFILQILWLTWINDYRRKLTGCIEYCNSLFVNGSHDCVSECTVLVQAGAWFISKPRVCRDSRVVWGRVVPRRKAEEGKSSPDKNRHQDLLRVWIIFWYWTL